MLEPRETDLPALFLVFIVLPLVTYILLGKWNESSKKKERISVLAHLAAEEALRVETMAAASAIPHVPLPKNTTFECARCCAPATTRCSRCKSIRYCSGRCQIIHWRQVHKHECQQLENNSSGSSPKPASDVESVGERFLYNENMDPQCFGYNIKQPRHEAPLSEDTIHSPVSKLHSSMAIDTSGVSLMERITIDKQVSRKSNRENLRREDGIMLESSEEASKSSATCSISSNSTSSKESYKRHKLKLREVTSVLSPEEIPEKCDVNVSANNETNVLDIDVDFPNGGNLLSEGIATNDETVTWPSERTSVKRGNKEKNVSHSTGTKMHKSPKSTAKVSRERLCSDTQRKSHMGDESKVSRVRDTTPAQGKSGVATMGIMKMIGLMKSPKKDKQEVSEVNSGRHKKIKMLFPYEEFVKFFQYEVFDLAPKGLINCGNSCYANAVLQCLTCTRPLTIYLLRRSHSRTCCGKDWCLMCELEQHVMMMRQSEGPLSLSGLLLHMRSINCQISYGSQEDAHEFLRILVTSMQSICLEGFGKGDAVDPRLQETTFIQHTFRGRLRSKVKCLRCHHESERYENIMDLTLEIFGWVGSLEDALTQFTSPEDLDGENMYKCGRCTAYVRAQKQLSIQEAPNILTIVLKRFQEGSYGKINKCISFPEMLDMIPFMTGTDDIPPLYMLYAVVVHLDTLNASFSGHYVSYVKNLQGNWFRIDDTEVQPVTVSQVMSEGAYILFYMRSWPRPPRPCTGKPTRHQAPVIAKHIASKTRNSSRSGRSDSSCHFVGQVPYSDHRPEAAVDFADHTSNEILRNANRNMEFSDAMSSDWSLFTISDDASFTTESTRDSFSTVDYADAIDPISSIFNTLYAPEYSSHKTVSCSRFASSKSQTNFVSEGKSCVLDSCSSIQPLDLVRKWENPKQVTESFPSDNNCGIYVNYENNQQDGPRRTLGHCKF